MSQNTKANKISFRRSFDSNMVFHQVIAAFHALLDAIGLPGNLLVIVTIIFVKRFHLMRYILLASLAVSDILYLILVNSFRIASIAEERWPYGQTMCYLNPFFGSYLYIKTVLHLMAVSYERYDAIVKSPLTYDGTITKWSAVFIAFIWIIPLPFTIGPFLGWGKYVYNPEAFFCQTAWTMQSGSSGTNTTLALAFLVIPFLIIAILNLSVYKTAKAHANAEAIQVGSLADSESQQQETLRRILRRRRKAAVDVSIIIAAFMMCFLPTWIMGFCRQFVKSIEVPGEAVLFTSCFFTVSSVCNPIIYSIRKREFRTDIKNLLERIGLLGTSIDDAIAMDNLRLGANLNPESSRPQTPAAEIATQHQDGRLFQTTGGVDVNFQRRYLSPIPEVSEEDD